MKSRLARGLSVITALAGCGLDNRALDGLDASSIRVDASSVGADASLDASSLDAPDSCRSPSECLAAGDAAPTLTRDTRSSVFEADASVDGSVDADRIDAGDGGDARGEAEACAPNACGGCATLTAVMGAACGSCGKYVCASGGESLSCQDPAVGTVQAAAAGQGHTCVLTTNGGVRCWGFNANGQLGDGTTTDRATPPTADMLTGVQAISIGGSDTCALMSTGMVKCWGYGFHGELGNGSGADRSVPTDVLTATGPLSGVRAIVSGRNHTCTLMLDGGVRCWGMNDQGQLGDGTNTNRVVAPTSNVLTGAEAIAAGFFHTCALTATGVQCWGTNVAGQIGDGTTVNRLTPTTVMTPTGALVGVRAIAAGASHTCALMMTGGVRCWGTNDVGQLGDGTGANRFTAPNMDIPTGFAVVVAGAFHNCGLTPAGGARCWGWNTQGQLGDGTMSSRFLAISPDILTGVTALAAGEAHSCAVTTNGIQCWGFDMYGQLGDGTMTTRSSPAATVPICP